MIVYAFEPQNDNIKTNSFYFWIHIYIIYYRGQLMLKFESFFRFHGLLDQKVFLFQGVEIAESV